MPRGLSQERTPARFAWLHWRALIVGNEQQSDPVNLLHSHMLSSRSLTYPIPRVLVQRSTQVGPCGSLEGVLRRTEELP